MLSRRNWEIYLQIVALPLAQSVYFMYFAIFTLYIKCSQFPRQIYPDSWGTTAPLHVWIPKTVRTNPKDGLHFTSSWHLQHHYLTNLISTKTEEIVRFDQPPI